MGIIISMNDKESYYRTCESCGRPMAYCKGQCCGQPKGCSCQEYGPMKAGCLREIEPSCPYQAVIPTLTVEDKSNLKDLADCFVHVSNINTTFYIDDKHRTIVTWAGPVEYDNYDLVANSLGLRSQFLIDFANERGAYYDKTGNYKIFNFGNSGGGGCCDVMTLDVSYNTEATYWRMGKGGGILSGADIAEHNCVSIVAFEVPNPSFTDHDTGDTYQLGEVFEMLESGANIRFNGIPVGYYQSSDHDYGNFDCISICDNVELATKSTNLDAYGNTHSYSCVAFPQSPSPSVNAALGIAIRKELNAHGEVSGYVLTTQGYYDYRYRLPS